MSEGDRPAETTSRVIPMRSRLRAGRVSQLLSPGEVARRLAALERQVEEALGAERMHHGPSLVESLVDQALTAYAAGRTWLAEQGAGLSSMALGDAWLAGLARVWWRVDVVGRERLPHGPALLVGNRGSALLPYEAFMTAVALGTERARTRVWPLVDEWLMNLPLVGAGLRSLGAQAVSAVRVRQLLSTGTSALVFPEGREAVGRPYADAYRVGRLARATVLRVALETGSPIVPVGIIGVDEVHPVLARLPLAAMASIVGVPALPVPATLVPLPTKWTIFVGDPLDAAAHYRGADPRDPAVARSLAIQVRERLQALVSDGVRRRRSIFF
jgi:1-acyl-sn-glycerol-3-phosphate acyltransferase